jgi:hypothetical protein
MKWLMQTLTEIDRTDVAYTILTQTTRPSWGYVVRKDGTPTDYEGIIPNGSGFYMGVVNVPGQCYSILKWDGTPTDYEGIISRDCSFLQCAILLKDPAHALFDEAEKFAPRVPGENATQTSQ